MNSRALQYLVHYEQDDRYDIGKTDGEGFNARISKMIKGLIITRFGDNIFNYELEGKTYRGISVHFYDDIFEITIPIFSNEFDYKLADLLLGYLAFYSNGSVENQVFEKKIDFPYGNALEHDSYSYSVIKQPTINSGELIQKYQKNGRD
ncbi:hypothetical protein [Chryseobacterium sp. SL1]|uniref:hypothetical protein n=1 Tax=Chryseobacterium sp. SL1 TaxID=2995159 RepID=UPI002275248F|nr:hypothetical protein [Chryseobacterium sp. SL1]MCY1660375.1 hypothetical protein [Chryseobacterium sp. SL1]